MKNLFKKLAYVSAGCIVWGVLFLGGGFAFAIFNPEGGGTYVLQGSISSSQTSITLTSFTEPGSNIPLTMSYMNTAIAYGTINPSSGNSEFISFTGVTQNVNGTALLTGVTRGLARTPGAVGCVGSTTLAHAYPGQTQFILSNSPCYYSQYAVKQNDEVISGQWTFTTFPITPASPAASETTAGISELSTAAEAAAGTSAGGTGFRLVLPGSLATSTYNSATAANKVLVTGVSGKLDNNFIATSTLFAAPILGGGNTVFASSTVYATTTTGTWTKPANLKYVSVEVVGGGGGGGGCTDSSRSAQGGAGGGYALKVIPAAAISSTVTVTVGAAGAAGAAAGGAGGNGGSSSFGSFVSATGATGGAACLASVGPNNGGGTGSSGDVNLTGQSGSGGATDVAGTFVVGGAGGSSPMGYGQGGAVNTAATTAVTGGSAATGFGGGGSGALNANSASDNAGGAGTQGVVVITSVFY